MCSYRSNVKIKRFIHILPLAALLLCACARNDRSHAEYVPDKRSGPPTAATAVVNINTATAAELEALPYIGPGIAQQIVQHREKHGPFRRPEHLILIPGMSDKRFRAIRHLITVD